MAVATQAAHERSCWVLSSRRDGRLCSSVHGWYPRVPVMNQATNPWTPSPSRPGGRSGLIVWPCHRQPRCAACRASVSNRCLSRPRRRHECSAEKRKKAPKTRKKTFCEKKSDGIAGGKERKGAQYACPNGRASRGACGLYEIDDALNKANDRGRQIFSRISSRDLLYYFAK